MKDQNTINLGQISGEMKTWHNCIMRSKGDVVESVKRLKRGKSDESVLYSDHVIIGPHKRFVLLTCLFNAMLVHECCPNNMLNGTVVPIPKCKRAGMSPSVNYRAIILGIAICKLFDYIILNKEQERMSSNDLQFGFKRNVSTMHPAFVLSEVISYYNYNRTNVCAVFLDATKVFDRVKYSNLFRILIDQDVTPIVLRLLLYMYTKQALGFRKLN